MFLLAFVLFRFNINSSFYRALVYLPWGSVKMSRCCCESSFTPFHIKGWKSFSVSVMYSSFLFFVGKYLFFYFFSILTEHILAAHWCCRKAAPYAIIVPLCKTSHFQSYFIPHTIGLWNNIPEDVELELHKFKR